MKYEMPDSGDVQRQKENSKSNEAVTLNGYCNIYSWR